MNPKTLSNYALLLPAMLALGPFAHAGQKVELCHVAGNGTIKMIGVSVEAHPAHMDHGDFAPFTYYEDPTGLGCYDETTGEPGNPSIASCEDVDGYTRGDLFPTCPPVQGDGAMPGECAPPEDGAFNTFDPVYQDCESADPRH